MPTSEPKTPATTPVFADRVTKYLMSRRAENNCYYCNAIQLAIDEEPQIEAYGGVSSKDIFYSYNTAR